MRSRRPRSLGSKVATTVAIVAAVLGLIAASVAVVAAWQRQRADAEERAAGLAFDASDAGPSKITSLRLHRGEMAFVFASNGDVTLADERTPDDVIDAAVQSVGDDATESDVVSSATETVGRDRWAFAAIACTNTRDCESIITGVSSADLMTYVLAHALALAAATLASGFIAYGAARWLVGRALRPIESMRRDVAAITTSSLDRRVAVPEAVDEVQRVALTLNETLDRLEAAVRANERFVADAAHELRSPLTGVRVALEVEATRTSRPLLSEALGEVDRASAVVDDLLLLARRASLPPRRVDIDLDDLLREEVAALRRRFPEVRVDLAAPPARIVGDPDAVRRAVRNLLDNAAFYGHGHVAAAVAIDAESIRVHVDDDGPGIAPQDRVRVFERFTRLDSSRARSTGGTGLGLAIVHEIVAAHGGTMSISDSPLGGARFEARFLAAV